MNVRTAVLCPTRGRPLDFRCFAQSVMSTSRADVLAYVDDDQQDLYADVLGPDTPKRIRWMVAPKIGLVASINALVKQFDDYDFYGYVPDDATMETPGWDDWALEATDRFPNGICVISPYHNQGHHVDMPFVTAAWIKATGWFACPDLHHHSSSIITGLIGEMSAIVHAPKQSFSIYHPAKVEMVSENLLAKDLQAFFTFTALKLPAVVDRVREAMAR